MNVDYWRQSDIVEPSELKPVTVAGVGGIGSPTTLALAKMGCKEITVFDPDKVENHNIPNQIYRPEDIDLSKVSCLQEIVKSFTGIEIQTHAEKFQVDKLSPGVLISAVDTMSMRKEIWKEIKFNAAIDFYIDARMGGEIARIHTICPHDPDQIKFYENTLYSDDEADDLPCTERSIIYNVFLISALIANQVKRVSKGETPHRELIFDFSTLTLTKSPLREKGGVANGS